MNRRTDEWIVEQLSSSRQSDKDKAMVYIYKRIYTQVSSWMLNNKANVADVEDILQDSLIVLYNKVRKDDINKVVNIEAYIFKVCKNLWLRRLQRSGKEINISELSTDIPESAKGLTTLEDDEQRKALFQLLSKLGQTCQEILKYFYYERISMKEIAIKMGYSGEQVAKNKKSNCLKEVRLILADAPELAKLLKSY